MSFIWRLRFDLACCGRPPNDFEHHWQHSTSLVVGGDIDDSAVKLERVSEPGLTSTSIGSPRSVRPGTPKLALTGLVLGEIPDCGVGLLLHHSMILLSWLLGTIMVVFVDGKWTQEVV